MKQTLTTKNSILFFLAFCFAINCMAQRNRNQVPYPYQKKYPEKYQDQLEPGSKLLAALYHITVEKTVDKTYIKKQYYPSTKQITLYETYADKRLTVKEGITKRWSETGELMSETLYKNNQPVGEGKEYGHQDGEMFLKKKGSYKDGKKDGKWETYNQDGEVVRTTNYANGKLLPKPPKFTPAQRDSLKLANKNRKPKPGSDKKIYKVVEDMPTFPGCESEEDKMERKKCAENKMLKFVYGNIKYPPIARKEGVEGRVILSYVVTKTGEITDVKALRGPSEELKLEANRVVESMPKWNPGKQRGQAVDVKYTLPIVFKIESRSYNPNTLKRKRRKRTRRN